MTGKTNLLFRNLICCIGLICLPATLVAQNVAQDVARDWELIWSDEFNYTGKPDDRSWSYENGFVRNEEYQWYQPENVYVENGLLVIEARREKRENPLYKKSSDSWRTNRQNIEYTSASIKTVGKKEFLYGRFEIKARIPTAGGSWPAIWTLGKNMPWPSNGEIDIMEYYRIRGVPHILANTAWGTDRPSNAKWDTQTVPFENFLSKDPEWASKFHVWRMDWDETAIRLYLDDELLNETLLTETINGSIGNGTNPFKQPHYLLLNLAIGGRNGGEPDLNAFPLKYEIDYVRVYQKKQTIRPGELWPDDRGVHINAHGGGILFHQGKYYWYGEHKSEQSSAALVGITCYSSTDLCNWTYEGVVLPVSGDENSDIVRGSVMERPKVIYNEKTGKFVMWFHLELKGKGYSAARAALAVSDTPTGTFTYIRSGRVNPGVFPFDMNEEDRLAKLDTADYRKWWTPEWHKAVDKGLFVQRDLESGQMSRDMTLYVDDDGKAYHIYSSEENLTIHIAELTDDYQGHSGKYTRVSPSGHNEAPAIFKKDGVYWMITSGCTGWAPNAARMFSAPSIWGPWKQYANPCLGDNAQLTFGGQSTYILTVPGKKNEFIFMADIWRPRNPIDARYIWIPIRFDGNGIPYLQWEKEWRPSAIAAHSKMDKPAKPEWQDPAVFAVNKEVARATSIPYPTQELAVGDNYQASPYYRLLSGVWKFNWAPRAADAPEDFYREDYDVTGWADMPVPGNWEFNGSGIPVYVASGFGFKAPFFETDPEDTPTGSYRHEFDIPSTWDGRRVFLHFEGGTTAMYVWINGRKAGYTENAKSPAEFDITPYIRQGRNTIACRVYKYADGSYMEDQDFWRLGGINRDVYLYSTAQTRIYDYFSHADLDTNYRNGLFSAEVKLKNYTGRVETQSLTVDVIDNKGEKVLSKTRKVDIPAGNTTEVALSGTVSSPLKWTAETPNLYTLLITLKDNSGKIVETTSHRIGFRKIEIKDAQMFLNGKKLWFKGVNLHEFNTRTGAVVTEKEMMRNIQLMKELNINAVRTSHYPQKPLWYKLCDKYGIYLVDESNLESHGVRHLGAGMISNLPEWRQAHVDRIVSVVERDKNHPSVIMWSLGNEAGNGEAFQVNYEWAKRRDPSRPTVYEPAWNAPNSDVSFPMYPSYESMLRSAAQELPRPYIMCEYAHAMGNSMGNMQEYWDVMRSSKNMQGGFIWEWYNHGFGARDEQGRFYWAYGGDLGGYMRMNSDNFCMDGIISPDQQYVPHTWVVKQVYRNMWAESADPASGVVTIVNDFVFTDITPQNYGFKWVLLKNGKQVGDGTFDVTVPAASRKDVKLALPAIASGPGAEYFLHVFAYTRQAGEFIPANFECAKSEIAFPANDYFTANREVGDIALKVDKNEERIVVTAGNMVYTAFTGAPAPNPDRPAATTATVGAGASEAAGAAQRFRRNRGPGFAAAIDGRPVFMPSLNFWRAPNDNDFGSGDQTAMRLWEVAGRNPVLTWKGYTETNGTFSFAYEAKLRGIEAKVDLTYTVNTDGSLTVSAGYRALSDDLPEMMRFGMIMSLPKAYNNFTWYGRGPHENYVDRNTDAFIGIWEGKVDSQTFPYYRPQETGNKTDVRWLTLKDDNGNGIMISGRQALSVSATNNRPEDLDPGVTKKQQHASDVKPRNEVALCIDLFQRGVGGLHSWGAKPLDKYRFTDTAYNYEFVIRPLQAP